MKNKWLLGLLMLILAGCSKEDMIAKFTPRQEDQEARAYIQQLQDKKLESIEAHLDPGIQSANAHKALEKMASLLPAGQPKSIKTIGAQTVENNGVKQVNLTYEVEYPNQWFVINVMTRRKDGNVFLAGFHIAPQTDSVENLFRFSLRGKSTRHYIVFALTVAAALFTLVTLIACIRIKPLKRKWLWIIGILFGVGQWGLNWSTGDMSFHALNFQLFSAGAFAAPYGPWNLSVSVPVFAIVFWIRRQSLIRQAQGMSGDKRTEKPAAV